MVLQDEFVADAAQKPTAAGRQLHLLQLVIKLQYLYLVSHFPDHPTNDSNSALDADGEILNNAQKQNAETATTTNQVNNEGTHCYTTILRDIMNCTVGLGSRLFCASSHSLP